MKKFYLVEDKEEKKIPKEFPKTQESTPQEISKEEIKKFEDSIKRINQIREALRKEGKLKEKDADEANK